MIGGGAEEFGWVLLAAIGAYVVVGATVGFAVRDAYERIGAGKLALDVSDHVAPEPIESPAGQAEVQQLLDAIEAVRRERDARRS